MADKPVKISPALGKIRERLFESLPDDGLNVQARAMAAHVGSLHRKLEALESLAEKRNPAETEARHAQRVADAAKQIEQALPKTWDDLNELFRDGVTALEQRAAKTAGLKGDGYAEEVRAAFRSMKDSDRRSALLKAVESGDGAVVAALVDAPSVVTGIDGQYAERMKQTFLEQHAPAESRAMTALSDTMSSATYAASNARRAAQSATDPAYIAKIQREAEQADAAAQSFKEAMNE